LGGDLFPRNILRSSSSICLWINADEMIVFLSNVLRFVRTGMFLLKVVLARYVGKSLRFACESVRWHFWNRLSTWVPPKPANMVTLKSIWLELM
jgi:hypothetical protein